MNWKTIRLGEIAVEDRRIISPESAEATSRSYLGLDQIESGTGRVLSYESNSTEGKSTTFAFDESHVLYGKLRPYLNKVVAPNRSGRCSTEIIPLLPRDVDREFLAYLLRTDAVVDAAMSEKTGSRMPRADMDVLLDLEISIPDSDQAQRQIAARLKAQLAEVETARQAAQMQVREISRLADAIVMDTVHNHPIIDCSLGDVLAEVKRGIGANWSDYPVLGATRDGLAPAKEAPGKQAPKYKPVLPGTVFYNPMRILIGSIAFVDDDDEIGITSPDYVVLQGKPEQVDSRWFYYWLRSPLGVACINSLARGAVRERMLFNRLAEGKKTPLTLAHFGFGKEGALLDDDALPVALLSEWQADEAKAGQPFPSYARQLAARDDSRYSWTVDVAARRAQAQEDMQPLQAKAAGIKAAVVDLKEDLKRLKKEKSDGRKIEALEASIREQEKAARDLEAEAATIDAAVFDLKAVNPNAVAVVDERTPGEIIASITAQGRIVADALARLNQLMAAPEAPV
jgi:restriction endonuclease S subunit